MSDLRAPTPSAAAELAVSDVSKIRERLLEFNAGLNIRINGFLKNYSDRISSYNVKLILQLFRYYVQGLMDFHLSPD